MFAARIEKSVKRFLEFFRGFRSVLGFVDRVGERSAPRMGPGVARRRRRPLADGPGNAGHAGKLGCAARQLSIERTGSEVMRAAWKAGRTPAPADDGALRPSESHTLAASRSWSRPEGIEGARVAPCSGGPGRPAETHPGRGSGATPVLGPSHPESGKVKRGRSGPAPGLASPPGASTAVGRSSNVPLRTPSDPAWPANPRSVGEPPAPPTSNPKGPILGAGDSPTQATRSCPAATSGATARLAVFERPSPSLGALLCVVSLAPCHGSRDGVRKRTRRRSSALLPVSPAGRPRRGVSATTTASPRSRGSKRGVTRF